jgi:hypothetical protein
VNYLLEPSGSAGEAGVIEEKATHLFTLMRLSFRESQHKKITYESFSIIPNHFLDSTKLVY